MNSEELEISLRTEFENYLKNVFADMRQEISQLQSKLEADLENYKAQLDESFKGALNRADQIDFDAGFKDSVLEHLRLARDEGSRISAAAFAAAEDLKEQQAAEQAKAGRAEDEAAVEGRVAEHRRFLCRVHAPLFAGKARKVSVASERRLRFPWPERRGRWTFTS